ncbi:MAG: 50S ribosomal protein L31 [Bacillota bacterium]|nr:50S ribosomal protein L31 [Bacillota bacterium]
MKKDIHPNYADAVISCVCGEQIKTRSTKGDIKVEICSKCHPFFTGTGKSIIQAGGRVEKFKQKYGM